MSGSSGGNTVVLGQNSMVELPPMSPICYGSRLCRDIMAISSFLQVRGGSWGGGVAPKIGGFPGHQGDMSTLSSHKADFKKAPV